MRDIRAETGKDAQSFVRDGRAAFRATRAIPAHEEVMIVVRFPKGVVQPPKVDFRGLLAVLVLLVLTAAALYRLRTISAAGSARSPAA